MRFAWIKYRGISSILFNIKGRDVDCFIFLHYVIMCKVVKNIVLAGVNVVLQDSTNVLESDLSFAFCCGVEHIGQNVSVRFNIVSFLPCELTFIHIDDSLRKLREITCKI